MDATSTWGNPIFVTPLLAACDQGHLEVVQLLVEKECDVNKAMDNGATPLYRIPHATKGVLKSCDCSKEKGCDVNKAMDNGTTLLYTACNHGHLEIVRLFLENGCDALISLTRTVGKHHYISHATEGTPKS